MKGIKRTVAVIAIFMFLFVFMPAPGNADSTTGIPWEVESLQARVEALEAVVAAQSTVIATLEDRLMDAVAALQSADAALDVRVSNNTQAIGGLQENNSLQSQQITTLINTVLDTNTIIGGLQTDVASLNQSLEMLATSPIFDLKDYVSVVTETWPDPDTGLRGPHVIFQGVNLHIRNDSGTTCPDYGNPDGLGNLVVGYNEPPAPVYQMQGWERQGSHNIIVGSMHHYSGCGSFISGFQNTTIEHGQYATVTGGQNNSASGFASTVSGGYGNIAGDDFATVSGGGLNRASHEYSAISGGFDQETTIHHDHRP